MRLREPFLGAVFLAAWALWSTVACEARDYDAAGILAFTRVQEETYVLLADHPGTTRGWGTFGGNSEKGESPAQTASREFHEETRCVYARPTADDLTRKPVVIQGTFLCFVVEVPFIPAQVFENKPAPEGCEGPSYWERGPWVWIPLREIVASLETVDSTGGYVLPQTYIAQGSTRKLWDKSATVLERAVAEGFLE